MNISKIFLLNFFHLFYILTPQFPLPLLVFSQLPTSSSLSTPSIPLLTSFRKGQASYPPNMAYQVAVRLGCPITSCPIKAG